MTLKSNNFVIYLQLNNIIITVSKEVKSKLKSLRVGVHSREHTCCVLSSNVSIICDWLPQIPVILKRMFARVSYLGFSHLKCMLFWLQAFNAVKWIMFLHTALMYHWALSYETKVYKCLCDNVPEHQEKWRSSVCASPFVSFHTNQRTFGCVWQSCNSSIIIEYLCCYISLSVSVLDERY